MKGSGMQVPPRQMSLAELAMDGDIEKFRYGLREFIQDAIDGQTLDDYTPLMLACQEGHIDIVRLLLEQEVDVNLQNENNDTALIEACFNGHTEIVQLLMQREDIDVNLQNENTDNIIDRSLFRRAYKNRTIADATRRH